MSTTLKIQKGTDEVIVFPVLIKNNETGVSSFQDLTGAYLYFQIYEKDCTTLVLAKDNDPDGVNSGIVVRDQGLTESVGHLEVHIEHEDLLLAEAADRLPYVLFMRIDPLGSDDRYEVTRGLVNIGKTLGVPDPSYIPPPSPSSLATQTPQERSFKWTAPSTADVFTVSIPGTGMVDATYCIQQPGFSNIPPGGSWVAVDCPESGRTPTAFQLRGNAPIEIGTVLDFHLRDS